MCRILKDWHKKKDRGSGGKMGEKQDAGSANISTMEARKDTLYSFDVFDTLITRSVAYPTDVFWLMQDALVERGLLRECGILRQNFCKLRQSEETTARIVAEKVLDKEDCTLQEIYDLLMQDHLLQQSERDALLDLEIEMELKVSLPIYENIDKVVALKKAGCKVVLVSDMYLPSDVIRKLLCKHSDVFCDVPIYVSNEAGMLKSTGHLWEYVKKAEQPARWVHTGDNKKADVESAKKYVTQAIYYAFPPLLPHEVDALKLNPRDTLLVGTARYCRIGKMGKKDVYLYGNSFSAPILYTYIDYVLSLAKKAGLRDLFFIARDGYVLQRMADIVIKERGLRIKTHYFYSSRVASRVITAENFDEYVNMYFADKKERGRNLIEIAERVCVSVEYFQELTGLHFPPFKKLPQETIDAIHKQILEQKDVRDALIKKNEERSSRFIAYLKQELGERKSPDFAFVEYHGFGVTQCRIGEVLKSSLGFTAPAFYFARDVLQGVHLTMPICFFLHTNLVRSWFIELIARAPDGRTMDYKQVGGKMEPVFEMEVLQPLVDWGFYEHLEAVLDYTKMIARVEENLGGGGYSLLFLLLSIFARWYTMAATRGFQVLLGIFRLSRMATRGA